ncbi:MAG TPA: aldo/keto reductase [Dehalococcoidia bacterium]|nr:aldo/keto reductase [Dehalococcoidia bacterium]
MRYRMLGRSQLMTSEVGFGGWAIGGGWGPVDDDTSIAAIRKAIDAGVSFIDTADVYGEGHGEEVIGKALEGNARHRAVIATKAGLKAPSGHDFSPAHIEKALEGSLRRLGTDWVDVLQLHNPTRAALEDPELWETLKRLKAEGKIRAYGASVRSPREAVLAIENGDVDTVQVVFNVIDQEARELFETARAHRVGVIARVPLASGFLTGKYSHDHKFHRTDWRARLGPARRRQMLRRAEALDPVARGVGSSKAQAALAFVLSYRDVAVTIPGVKTPEQAEENAASSDVAPLPAELLRYLEQAYEETEAPTLSAAASEA